MPSHGAVKDRRIETHELGTQVSFPAPNGEGLCILPAVMTLPHELRYCAVCEDWRRIRGTMAFLQADYVGCEKCGTPWDKPN